MDYNKKNTIKTKIREIIPETNLYFRNSLNKSTWDQKRLTWFTPVDASTHGNCYKPSSTRYDVTTFLIIAGQYKERCLKNRKCSSVKINKICPVKQIRLLG